MKLSIVTTLYQSASYINEFYNRASKVAQEHAGDEYEIIFVNDGSPDNSLDIAVELTEHDKHILVVDLSRNFGHHKALMTGLAHSSAEKVFLIDSDLEEEPEYLHAFSKQMQEQKCDVVFGIQDKRKGNWVERITGECFYRFFILLSGIALPKNLVTARLMTRRYVDALLQHEEREVFMPGLFYITGFDQRPQTVKKKSSSESTYTLRRKLSHVVNSVTSFSNTPLNSIFYTGFMISFVSFSYCIYLVIEWYLGQPPSGWTSVMASIWLLGGMVISFVGIIGIYLSKIFSEIKRRPYSIIRRVYKKKN